MRPPSRDHLPTHPVREAMADRTHWRIRVDGLVACPRIAAGADLAGLLRYEIRDDFVCQEGWSVPAFAGMASSWPMCSPWRAPVPRRSTSVSHPQITSCRSLLSTRRRRCSATGSMAASYQRSTVVRGGS